MSIGKGVTKIASRAFRNCSALEELEIGGATEIESRAFYGCSSLKNLILPDSLISIGDYAFYGCSGLETIVFGSSLKRIGSHAFYLCESLVRAELPESVSFIDSQAFRYCRSLKEVVFRGEVGSLGSHVFYGCNNLTVYCKSAQPTSGWDLLWNSSFRPVVWGSTFSSEGYLISFEKGTSGISNGDARNGISPPSREGYSFGGWTTKPEETVAEYTVETVDSAPNGIVLYAIWLPE